MNVYRQSVLWNGRTSLDQRAENAAGAGGGELNTDRYERKKHWFSSLYGLFSVHFNCNPPPLHFHSLFPIPHSSVFMDEKCFIVTENWVVRVIRILTLDCASHDDSIYLSFPFRPLSNWKSDIVDMYHDMDSIPFPSWQSVQRRSMIVKICQLFPPRNSSLRHIFFLSLMISGHHITNFTYLSKYKFLHFLWMSVGYRIVRDTGRSCRHLHSRFGENP